MQKLNRIFILGILCMATCMVFFGCKAKDEELFIESYEEDTASSFEDSEISENLDNTLLCAYICGAVRTPGVYEFSNGSRICDAIESAGGFTEEADINYLNQAEFLYDGQMIYVPTVLEAEEREQFEESDGKININTASKELLMSISGIGQGKADSIIKYREENGRFSTIDDIKNVSGIGESIFEKIREFITVS